MLSRKPDVLAEGPVKNETEFRSTLICYARNWYHKYVFCPHLISYLRPNTNDLSRKSMLGQGHRHSEWSGPDCLKWFSTLTVLSGEGPQTPMHMWNPGVKQDLNQLDQYSLITSLPSPIVGELQPDPEESFSENHKLKLGAFCLRISLRNSRSFRKKLKKKHLLALVRCMTLRDYLQPTHHLCWQRS